MTDTPLLPPLTVWATPVGVMLAITRPDAGPDDTATCVNMPVDYVLDVFLPAVLAALGALLWALRPVIVSAAMEAAPQQLTGSLVAFIYGANMAVSFLAPILAGVIADAYGLPAALHAIAFFPLVAAAVTFMLLKPARAVKS